MHVKMTGEEAKAFVDGIYRQVAERWRQRVSSTQFMKALVAGKLSKETFRLFFKNWAAYTIEINTLEAASYHKHIHFFRKHRDLMAAMAEKLADELIHPKPPGHIHVVIETAKALGISEDEVFVSPMLAEFRARSITFAPLSGKARWRSSMPPALPRSSSAIGRAKYSPL